MRYIYSALLYLALPVVALRMLLRSRHTAAYRRRMGERMGYFSAPEDNSTPAIWVHAVSVGEVLAAASLIDQLLLQYPGYRLIVTTTTPTGSERVCALFGERVFHVYAPWDIPGAVRRFLRSTRPRMLILMETELWPNMLHHCNAAGCRVLLANARLSERSMRGYLKLGSFSGDMLANLDGIAAQSVADARRFAALGVSENVLRVTGSIKFDLQIDDELRAKAAELRRSWTLSDRPVLVAASTHAGEDQLILAAYSHIRRSAGECLLVLVPRHPERFGEAYRLCSEAGWRTTRRSEGSAPGPRDDVLLGDTMGELLLLLGAADLAVVGGSLIEHGGHNVLEAAAWGVPVVTGPYMFNFAEISQLLVSASAMIQLQQPAELGTCLAQLLADPARRAAMGAAGEQVVATNRGAQQRLLQMVRETLEA